MDKPADTRYPINQLLRSRWSPRAFGDRPVETGKLHQIFEAARWAPSSFNEQPWGFIVAAKHEEDAHRAIAGCLVDANRGWAELAPVLMVTLARLTFDRNGKPNRHAYHDLGLAVGMMLVQATDLGLVAHQMGGFDQGKARAELKIPENFDPVAVMALGYPGDTETLPPELQADEYAPRQRKDFREFVWSGVFGTPRPFESRVKRALEGK